MARDQERQREPEPELGRLARAHPQRPSAMERPQRQAEMDQEGAPEQHRAGKAMPRGCQDGCGRLHRFDRHEAECDVDEMAKDIKPKDAAGPEPEAARRQRFGPPDRKGQHGAAPRMREGSDARLLPHRRVGADRRDAAVVGSSTSERRPETSLQHVRAWATGLA